MHTSEGTSPEKNNAERRKKSVKKTQNLTNKYTIDQIGFESNSIVCVFPSQSPPLASAKPPATREMTACAYITDGFVRNRSTYGGSGCHRAHLYGVTENN